MFASTIAGDGTDICTVMDESEGPNTETTQHLLKLLLTSHSSDLYWDPSARNAFPRTVSHPSPSCCVWVCAQFTPVYHPKKKNQHGQHTMIITQLYPCRMWDVFHGVRARDGVCRKQLAPRACRHLNDVFAPPGLRSCSPAEPGDKGGQSRAE